MQMRFCHIVAWLAFIALAVPLEVQGVVLRAANASTAATGISRQQQHLKGKNGTATTQQQQWPPQRPPRVYFLFLAVDKVSNLDVWNAFFAKAPAEQYRAFVHCKLPACNQQVAGTPLVVVATVPSYYCTDLVSPMNQLLAYALQDDAAGGPPSSFDKFAFVSDSTLPAKPFSYIYSALSTRQGSGFCIFPSNEWADTPSAQGMEMAVKHHQWITLDRAHAEQTSTLWASGKYHNFMTLFHMNVDAYTWTNNSYADNRNFGCLDEFWHMAALYGTLHEQAGQIDHQVPLSMFVGGPLTVSANAGWQGECDTFVVWAKYLHTAGNNPFNRLHSSLDQISVPHPGNSARPGWWDTITTTGLRSIRQSSFLFARKFVDKPRLHDGISFAASYEQLVLTI